MIDLKLCEWLLSNADVPICYRILRELLKDEQGAKNIEGKLLEQREVKSWLKHLKPDEPKQHHWMEHGSFDFNLENALSKVVQLGLHAELPQVTEALTYYIDKMEQSDNTKKPVRNYEFHDGFNHIIIANLLFLAGFKDEAILQFIVSSLDELNDFVQRGDYNIYCTEDERANIKGIPKIYKKRKLIKRRLLLEHGFCYPLIYDIVGLHKLYDLNNLEITNKVNAIITYISNDLFHSTIVDGYGIIAPTNKKIYAMGWDPKYPGWYGLEQYMVDGNVPKLLFFLQHIAKYPIARETKWFVEVLSYLDRYKTDNGTYVFPTSWLKESQGYAVMGSHLSFGENRRKRKWCEIESTFYMQLLYSDL